MLGLKDKKKIKNVWWNETNVFIFAAALRENVL